MKGQENDTNARVTRELVSGQWAGWPGFSSWFSIQLTVGSQANHVITLYLSFLTCKTETQQFPPGG